MADKTEDDSIESKTTQTAPVSAAAAASEEDKLWLEMAGKYDADGDVVHADPAASGNGASKDKTVTTQADKAETAQAKKPAKSSKDDKTAADKTQDHKDQAASKDAKAVDLWKGSEIDPKTNLPRDPKVAALKKAYDEAPESARPAIEELQRSNVNRGQEIARLRTTIQSSRTSAPASAEPEKKTVKARDVSKDPKWQTAMEEYEDVLAPVGTELNEAHAKIAKLEDRINSLEPAVVRVSNANDQSQAQRQESVFLDQHKDYNAVRGHEGFGTAFDGWLVSQPDAVKQMVDRQANGITNAAEASTIFTLFKAQTGFGADITSPETKAGNGQGDGATTQQPTQSARRRLQLDGSAEVANRGAGSQIAADKDDRDYWWEKHASRHRDADERFMH